MKNLFGTKVRVGRISIPVWTGVMALAISGLAAGQAVGPVLSGSVTGSAGLTVEQAVLLDTRDGFDVGLNPFVGGADDWATTRNDEGTEFTIAIELNVGETVYACVNLSNESGNDAAAMLELAVPAGIDVEVEEYSDSPDQHRGNPPAFECKSDMDEIGDETFVNESKQSRDAWLLFLDAGTGTGGKTYGDGVRLTVEPKDDLKPGFYTISGRLVQISG